MQIAKARVGARCVDSLPFSEGGTLEQAQALAAAGIDAVYGYLGVITAERVGYVLQVGMAFMPVTLGGHYDGNAAVAQLQALALPTGVAVPLDFEGPATLQVPVAEIIQKINAWGVAIEDAGDVPALYVGTPQPLTSEELWQLHVHGYWRGQGRIVDRTGQLAEPRRCGWWGYQAYPSVTVGGVLVDVDMITEDYLGRVPTWVVA